MTDLKKFITISQKSFKLKLWKQDEGGNQLKVIAEYDVAVGTNDHPTPKGYFVMTAKAKNPAWYPPDSDWVGPELRDENGVPIPIKGGVKENPIRGAFLALGDGIGIHGTFNVDSIGTKASHGCIRVTEEQALELYRRVPEGTIVRIY